MIRIPLNNGTANVSRNIDNKTIEALNDMSDKILDSFLCKCKKPKIIEQKGMNFCEKCRKEVELFNSK